MMTSENPPITLTPTRIKVTRDGPYQVKGAVPLQSRIILTDEEGTPIKWEPSTTYPTTKSCLLCRCGRSKNKPYCDSSHIEVAFDGTETAGNEEYLEKPDIVEGPALKLVDYKELCASARFCHRAGGIWNIVPKSDNPQNYKTACEESADCPSGRLVVKDKKTQTTVEPPLYPSIIFIEDPAIGASGPIWVCGRIPVESSEGREYQIRNRVTLCRCGKSQNKPFCDSSHYPEEHEPHGEDQS